MQMRIKKLRSSDKKVDQERAEMHDDSPTPAWQAAHPAPGPPPPARTQGPPQSAWRCRTADHKFIQCIVVVLGGDICGADMCPVMIRGHGGAASGRSSDMEHDRWDSCPGALGSQNTRNGLDRAEKQVAPRRMYNIQKKHLAPTSWPTARTLAGNLRALPCFRTCT